MKAFEQGKRVAVHAYEVVCLRKDRRTGDVETVSKKTYGRKAANDFFAVCTNGRDQGMIEVRLEKIDGHRVMKSWKASEQLL